MSIIYSESGNILYLPEDLSHDPNADEMYSLIYRPEYWNPESGYSKLNDVVIPYVSNGCIYECISGGISGEEEPEWLTIEGKSTKDNDVKWKAKPYLCTLKYDDIILESTWSSNVTANLTCSSIYLGIATSIRVGSVPPRAKSIQLTNTITIKRSSGRFEEFDKTLIILIKEI